jgi:RNA polymerase primary sigma factor
LSTYLRSVSNNNPLDVEEEQAAAKQLSELEQRMWRVVLGNPKTSVKLLKVLKNALSEKKTESAKTLRSTVDDILAKGPRHRSFEPAIDALATALCEVDEDRDLIADVTQHSRNLAKGAKNNSKESAAYLSHINEVAGRITGAKHRFIQENLGLVVNIAKRYHVEQMPLADLIQEGNIGLMRAVDKFDYRKGFRFSTYASWWIRSYISRAIVRKSSTVRIPEYMLRDRNRMKRTEEASRAKLGRPLSEEELAAELGVSQKRLNRTKKHDVAFVESLDREMPGNDHQKYIDFLADEETKNPFEATDLNHWIQSIPDRLGELSPTERFVLCWRFGLIDGEEMTLQEIGTCLNLSRERVRQIQEEALVKLRTKLEVDAA